jgi:hypothetical protein
VSVLPQLQRELSAAHARRRRRLPRIRFGSGFGAAQVVLATAVAVAVVVVAVVALRPGGSPERPAASPGAVYRGYISLSYAAGGSLYGILPDHPNSPSVSTPPDLVRIDPGSGKVVAHQELAPPSTPAPGGGTEQPIPEPEHLLVAGGSLWATATDSQETWLWRLDPRTLAVRSFGRLPGGGFAGTGSMALAGGSLWVVNYNTLIRISPRTGRVVSTRTFSRSVAGLGNVVAADQSGRTLVLTVAGPKTGSLVEVLNPRTGLPTAASAAFSGATPQLAGVLDGGAWINGLTSSGGGPARFDLNTLKVTATGGRFALTAQVFGGLVVVSGRGAVRCVDALSGRTVATLPDVVAAEGSTAYVSVRSHGIPEIHRETLDPRCLETP